ncbi:MAG: hypothetical protein ACOH5I_10575 [Oligoflexus sp.]
MRKHLPSTLSVLCLGASASLGFAAQEFDPDEVLKRSVDLDKAAYLEYLNYEQKVYSSAEDFELGEQTTFGTAFKIHPAEDMFMRLRLEIDPKRNVFENKTSDVELILNHSFDRLEVQADLNLSFDDNDRGATSLGPDTDSDYSFIAYRPVDSLRLIFYPYNFDGAVGRVFYTHDVTHIYYIEGTPDFITNLPLRDTQIRMKTLPGLEAQWKFLDSWESYVGIAAGRYIYPVDSGFDIQVNDAASRWRTKSDIGYKLGLVYRGAEQAFFRVEYVSHDQADETGSLLASAASVQFEKRFGPLGIYAETSYSVAGSKAYNLDRSTDWFAETTPFRPVYSDFYGVKQDWLGKKDSAHYAKLSYYFGNQAPYVSYKHVGSNFVYWEEESAHRLRTADRALSHGGLDVYGFGWQIKAGQYTFTPEFEYKIAANKVFGNRLDLREDRELEELNRRASTFTLYTTYAL